MEVDASTTVEEGVDRAAHTRTLTTKGKERPPPIILITMVNLLKFQVEVKVIIIENFEL